MYYNSWKMNFPEPLNRPGFQETVPHGHPLQDVQQALPHCR